MYLFECLMYLLDIFYLFLLTTFLRLTHSVRRMYECTTTYECSFAQTEKLTHARQNGFLKIVLPLASGLVSDFCLKKLHSGTVWGVQTGSFCLSFASYKKRLTVRTWIWILICVKIYTCKWQRQIRKCAFSASTNTRGRLERRAEWVSVRVKVCVWVGDGMCVSMCVQVQKKREVEDGRGRLDVQCSHP